MMKYFLVMIKEQYDAADEAYAKASKLFPWSKS